MRGLPKWPEDQGGLFRDQTPASHILILVLWETWEVIDLSANRGYTDPPHGGLRVQSRTGDGDLTSRKSRTMKGVVA